MDLHEQIRDLQTDIRELKSLVTTLIQGNSPQETDEMLTVAEAAKLLKVSQKTITRYVHQKSIPFSRPSGKPNGALRFSKIALLQCSTAKKRLRMNKRTNEVTII